MSLVFHLKTLSESDKAEAVKKLLTDSTPDYDFFLLTALSMLMATLGLLLGSAPAVIGSMLIAPLLSPIISFALGIVMVDAKVMFRSLYTIFKASSVGVIASYLLASAFSSHTPTASLTPFFGTEQLIMYFLIAVIAGFAVSYSIARPDLSANFPGIAVAVTLIPPLADVGIGMSALQWAVIRGSFIVFVLNITGIVLASALFFFIMDIQNKQPVAEKTIKKEEKRLETEKKEETEYKEGSS